MNGLQFGREATIDSYFRMNQQVHSLTPLIDALLEIDMTKPGSNPAAIRLINAHPASKKLFDFDENCILETIQVKNRLLYAEENWVTGVSFRNHSACSSDMPNFTNISLDSKDQGLLRGVADILRFASGSATLKDNVCSDASALPHPENIDELLRLGILVDENSRNREISIKDDFEGVLRLQHASLLFRVNGVGILVDPHCHSIYGKDHFESNISSREIAKYTDVILISHTHGDHYSLTTLMMFSLNTTIVVPKVHVASILADDIASRLRNMGFTKVIELDWHEEPLNIKGAEIHSLPFYGEQPTSSSPLADKNLRNWGNTYLIRTPSLSTWILIDAGDDPAGKMIDVAKRVKSEFGPVDAVASNLNEFHPRTEKYITGAYHYWLCLPPELRREFKHMKHTSLTLGVKGVSDICAEVSARYFFPYAHWWGELSSHPRTELSILGKLESELSLRQIMTKIVPWTIGDAFLPKTGNVAYEPYLLKR
jgi:L-ascorbate metabolism protein UlaG (beta-lactamase superfamily)